MLVLHPKDEPPYILLDSLNAAQGSNGTATAANGTNEPLRLNGASHRAD